MRAGVDSHVKVNCSLPCDPGEGQTTQQSIMLKVTAPLMSGHLRKPFVSKLGIKKKPNRWVKNQNESAIKYTFSNDP